MSNDVLYHYTTGDVFRRILKNRTLVPDRSEEENVNEVPTVTFSADPIWENTRYRVGKLPDGQLVMMGKELLNRFCGGLIRITIPASLAPLDWKAMKDQLKMSQPTIQGIYNFALEVGARTRNWYSTTLPVPEIEWIAVEKWTPEGWIDLPEEDIVSMESEDELNQKIPVAVDGVEQVGDEKEVQKIEGLPEQL